MKKPLTSTEATARIARLDREIWSLQEQADELQAKLDSIDRDICAKQKERDDLEDDQIAREHHRDMI